MRSRDSLCKEKGRKGMKVHVASDRKLIIICYKIRLKPVSIGPALILVRIIIEEIILLP